MTRVGRGLAAALLCVLWVGEACAQSKPRPTKFSPPKVDTKLQAEYRARAKQHDCPKGIPWLQGTWEFVGESRVVNFSDRITFTGAKYVETISGGPPHKVEKGQLSGEIACILENRILITVTKAAPEGLFGNRSGDDYPCDVLTPIDQSRLDRVLLVCYVDWDLRTAKGLDLEFRKITPKKAQPDG